ncbi:MAG: alpha/beta fold hydrolase [Lysobacterales bacterium]
MARVIPISCWLLPLALASSTASALQIGEVSFTDCRLDGGNGSLPAQCATLQVPLYAEQPDGEQIELALAWLPARAEHPEPDPVVFLAGGPGQSALETWPRMDPILGELRRRRAVLLVDQRGTGGSAKLGCTQLEMDEFDREVTDADMQQLARTCLAELTVDPIPFTTEDAVADLERVRQALGLSQLNLFGGSYGTRMAQRYAKRHPAQVRTLLLDGVVPESLVLGSEHGRNLDAALAGQFQRCRENARCLEAIGDPAELLRSLREAVANGGDEVEVFHPRTMERRQLHFTQPILAGTVRLSSYAPESIALLPFVLKEALAGRPQGMIGQAWLLGDSLGESIAVGLNLSVSCAEDLPAFDSSQLEAEADTLLGAELVRSLKVQCEVWPHRQDPRPDRFEPLQGDWPTLLLSGEFDPVTPPRYGDAVAASLSHSRHLVAPGQGHIVSTRGCLPGLVSDFIESADPAALEAECLENLQAPAFFLNYNGAQP